MARWIRCVTIVSIALCAYGAVGLEIPNNPDGDWKVVGYELTRGIGAVSAKEAKKLVGKVQNFYKGTADGPFFSCPGGRVMDYADIPPSSRSNAEFKEIYIADWEKGGANFPNGATLFEHQMKCGKVDFRFLTNKEATKGYVSLDGALYELRRQK